MLCNRPFAGSVATTKPQGTTSTPSFSCGVVSANIGQNVPISMKEKMVKRPKKDSVLIKHKKWLADLQKTKERLEQEYLEEARRKEEEKIRFQEHEKKMRDLQRTIMNQGSDSKDDVSNYPSVPETKAQSKEESKSTKFALSAKPAWAVTEEVISYQFLQSLFSYTHNAYFDFVVKGGRKNFRGKTSQRRRRFVEFCSGS